MQIVSQQRVPWHTHRHCTVSFSSNDCHTRLITPFLCCSCTYCTRSRSLLHTLVSASTRFTITKFMIVMAGFCICKCTDQRSHRDAHEATPRFVRYVIQYVSYLFARSCCRSLFEYFLKVQRIHGSSSDKGNTCAHGTFGCIYVSLLTFLQNFYVVIGLSILSDCSIATFLSGLLWKSHSGLKRSARGSSDLVNSLVLITCHQNYSGVALTLLYTL